MIPLDFKFLIISASSSGHHFVFNPFVVGNPITSILSLTAMGIPSNLDNVVPELLLKSLFLASASALTLICVNALMRVSCSSI